MHDILDADYATCTPSYKGMKMANKSCAKSLDYNIYTFIFIFFIIKEKTLFLSEKLLELFVYTYAETSDMLILCKPLTLHKNLLIVKLCFVSSLGLILRYTYFPLTVIKSEMWNCLDMIRKD